MHHGENEAGIQVETLGRLPHQGHIPVGPDPEVLGDEVDAHGIARARLTVPGRIRGRLGPKGRLHLILEERLQALPGHGVALSIPHLVVKDGHARLEFACEHLPGLPEDPSPRKGRGLARSLRDQGLDLDAPALEVHPAPGGEVGIVVHPLPPAGDHHVLPFPGHLSLKGVPALLMGRLELQPGLFRLLSVGVVIGSRGRRCRTCWKGNPMKKKGRPGRKQDQNRTAVHSGRDRCTHRNAPK